MGGGLKIIYTMGRLPMFVGENTVKTPTKVAGWNNVEALTQANCQPLSNSALPLQM